jgi:diguanylate cyclase (GGDEF)-like protein
VAARELFNSPLIVVAGLSVEEQFAALRDRERGYYALAGLASLICVIALALLGRFGWQLARSREREVRIRQTHAERVEYLAYHDGLTGLANRSLFSKLLSQSLAEATRYERQLAVVYLDLDRFKPINDTLGHEAGDQLLQEIARRLQSCVRTSDTVARLGGDEFVVLVPQLQGDDEIVTVAEKILGAVGQPMLLMGREVCVTASIGIALSPRDGRDEETLKKNADAAMYQAKSQGKNNFQFYTDRLSSTSLERLSLEANLRHALERDELRLYYQARHDLTTGRVSGMEALLHWEHPDICVIPPSRFLAVAEESGVIIPIGRWVLKTACEQSLVLRRQGMPELCVTVSLSAAQFYDDRLLEDVRVVLAQTGLEPRLLELAIPETALTHRPEQTRERLQGLRKLGVRIAIGDFGFGYAWLEGLRDFSFDTIKIDRSLTRHVATSEQGAALAHAVIAVGRRLSGTVVAQGADTADEAQLLRTHGAGSLQGGCAGEPLPPEQFAASLRQEAATVLVPTSAHPGSKSRAG